MNDGDDKQPPDLELHRATKEQETLIGLADTLKQLKAMRQYILEYQEIAAELKWNKYQRLTDVGFSPEQALTMCLGTDLL